MKKKVEFRPPDTVTDQVGKVPVGTRLELMCQFAVKDDGRWCLVSIEGVPMPGYDANGNPEKEEHLESDGGEKMAARYKGALDGY